MGVAPCRSFRCPRQWSRGGHDRACFLVWSRLFRVADGERRCLRPQRFHGRAQDAAVRDAVDGQLSRSFDAGHGQRPGPVHGGPGSRPLPGAAEHLGLTRAGVDYIDYTVTGRGGYGARQATGYGADEAGWLFEGPRKRQACFASDCGPKACGGPGRYGRRLVLCGASGGYPLGDLGGARYFRAQSRGNQRHSEPRRHLGRAEDLLLILALRAWV